MRKSIIFAAFLAVGMMASAQKEVVKSAERKVKGNDFAAALTEIKPALTDPTTAEVQETWYWAGKAADGIYDQVFLKESMGENPSKEEKTLGGHALIDAVGYFKKAIALPDEKGKTPGKKTKEIIKILESRYGQLRNAGIFLLQAGDYDGAYDAWELYVNYPNDPVFEGKGPAAEPDTIVGQIKFYQAIAMLSENKNDVALKKLEETIPTGYSSIDVYRYGIEAANRLGEKPKIYEFAQKGYDKYGTEDIIFIGQLINGCLEANDYENSNKYIEKALAITPDTAIAIKSQIYDILGNVNEQEGKPELAITNFEKSIQIDPSFAKGYFDKGRILYNIAIKEDENSDGRTQARDVKNELLEAADLFKKAYQLDENLNQIPGILYRLYYRLGAGYEDEAEYWKNM